MNSHQLKKNEGTSFIEIVKSAFAALFGIQNSKNRERDFQKGKPSDFIAIGIIFVVLLLIGMGFLVKVILANAGV